MQPIVQEAALTMLRPQQAALVQRARLDPDSLTPGEVLQLQHTVGNQTVHQLVTRTVQAKGPGWQQGKAMPLTRDSSSGIRRIPMPAGPGHLVAAPQERQRSQDLSLPPVQSGSLARSEFDSLMQSHFGVGRIFNGTQSDQEKELRAASGNPNLAFNPANWQDWNPGSDSVLYAHIVNAFRQFVESFGGIPPVQEIGFFNLRYAYDPASAGVVAEPNVPAVFGAGTLLIYRYIERGAKALPTGRSSSGQASLPLPMREQTVSRIITHELGHGLVETALTPRSAGQAPDPDLLKDYMAAVGWSAGANPRLFDIGVPAVRQAITGGGVPDSAYEITGNNWNEPRWIEQPLSSYMTTHPSEDFPEAIMAYIVQPDLLRTRSPHRFQFIAQRVHRLGPLLRQIGPTRPPKGDFPMGGGEESYA